MISPRFGSEDSQRSEQEETLLDLAAALRDEGREDAAEWVAWAAEEIHQLRQDVNAARRWRRVSGS